MIDDTDASSMFNGIYKLKPSISDEEMINIYHNL